MSFSFYSLGTKKGVRREAENFKAYGDASQWEAAKSLILAEIEALPDSLPAVEVRAGGHHDEQSRGLSIEIKPVWSLALDPEEPTEADRNCKYPFKDVELPAGDGSPCGLGHDNPSLHSESAQAGTPDE